MASFPSPQRDPFLDSRVQAILSQRGRELAGLVLIGCAVAVALMLGSYAPEDPTWMAVTDDPVRNVLGRPGAAIASPFMIILGHGAWGLVLALAVWGLRLVLHRGDGDALGRLVFVPIAVALTSVWLATLVSGGQHGMGGRFGDVILGALLTALPLTSTLGFNLLTLAALAVALIVWRHVLAISRDEIAQAARFLMSGLVLSYAGLLSVMGFSARGMGSMAVRGAHQWRAHRNARAEARAQSRAQSRAAEAVDANHEWDRHGHWPAQPWAEQEHHHAEVWGGRRGPADEPPLRAPSAPASSRERPAVRVYRPDPAPTHAQGRTQQYAPVPPAQRPAYDRVNAFSPQAAQPEPPEWDIPDPELVEPDHPAFLADHQAPSPDHIRARLSDLIRNRKKPKPVLRFDPESHVVPPPAPAARRAAEPPLTAMPAAAPKTSAAASAPAPERPPAPPVPAFGMGFGFSLNPAAGFATPFDTAQDDSLIDDDAPPAAPARGDTVRSGERIVIQPQSRKPPAPSRRAQAEAQPTLPFERKTSSFELPPLSLLQDPTRIERYTLSNDALQENARALESVLEDYGVRGDIVSVRPGPVVTMYELEPAPGLKASRVIGLADDIARSMSALSARVSTVPGRSVIGIELPNTQREKVVLREILGARDFGDSQMKLPLALGKDIGGEAVVANLAKMPHLLIAGTTGSGKSVAINTMILSLLYKLTPAECRLIMIDPKMLELSVYDGIPHLLSPVVTDPKKAVVALKWVVGEMEERYRKMSKMGVRNIDGYNGRVKEALSRGELFKRTVQTGFDDETGEPVFETEEFAPEVLPYIVVIVDEMADLMMVAGKEIEACIQRLAQMARASGIHLIMATQRPSVDVITGTIKANFPTRISFQVTSKIDSRTILGEQGAEQLLGMGDMLYMAGGGRISRIHGPFVSDEEVEEVVSHLKSYGAPDYVSGVLEGPDGEREADIDAVLGLGDSGGEDALYDQAVAIVARDRKCSTSYIQRKLGIGYNKAARLVEQMEDQGVVSPANHVGKREILVPEVN